MIQRFEDEYPETRLPAESDELSHVRSSDSSRSSVSTPSADRSNRTLSSTAPDVGSDKEDDDDDGVDLKRKRHASEVSLAAKALTMEEGRVHRIGQKVKRDLIAEGGQEFFEDRIGTEHVRALQEKLHSLKDKKDHRDGNDDDEVAVVD
jgi:hypothetical protein